MPRPRFQNLDEAKREHIYDAAAKEFAQYGYDAASINRILEQAGLSKGAAYYYFDDKADFFISTVQHYTQQMLNIFDIEINPENDNAQTFWTQLKQAYANQLLTMLEQPWRNGVLRAAMTLSQEARGHEQLEQYFSLLTDAINDFLLKGQSIAAFRNDIPQSLLMAMLIGFDSSVDAWFAQNGAQFDMSERQKIASQIADSLQRLLATPE